MEERGRGVFLRAPIELAGKKWLGDGVGTGSGSDRVSRMYKVWPGATTTRLLPLSVLTPPATRSLPLPVLTSCDQRPWRLT